MVWIQEALETGTKNIKWSRILEKRIWPKELKETELSRKFIMTS